MAEITDNIHSAKGVIYRIYETEYIQTKKGILAKKQIVIEAASNKKGWARTSFHALEFFGDQCDKYENYHVGDAVDYQYRVDSRMSDKNGTERWFTSIILVSMSKKFMFDGPTAKGPDAGKLADEGVEEPRFKTFDLNADDLPF